MKRRKEKNTRLHWFFYWKANKRRRIE